MRGLCAVHLRDTVTTGPMTIFDRIFGTEDRRWVLRSPGREGERWVGFFEERGPSKIEETLRKPFSYSKKPLLRSSSSKNLPSSIFDLRLRRSTNPSISDLLPEEWVEDRTETRAGGCDFVEDGGVLRRWGGSSIFRPRRTKKLFPSSIFSARTTTNPLYFPRSRPEERRTPSFFFFRPPPGTLATNSSQLPWVLDT